MSLTSAASGISTQGEYVTNSENLNELARKLGLELWRVGFVARA
jgi:hypothetical protein